MQGKGPGFDPPRDLQHGPLAQSAERYPSQELLSLNDPEGINRHLAQSEARSPLETEVGGSSPPMSKGPRPGQGRGPAIFLGRKNVSTTCGDTSGGSGSDGHTHTGARTIKTTGEVTYAASCPTRGGAQSATTPGFSSKRGQPLHVRQSRHAPLARPVSSVEEHFLGKKEVPRSIRGRGSDNAQHRQGDGRGSRGEHDGQDQHVPGVRVLQSGHAAFVSKLTVAHGPACASSGSVDQARTQAVSSVPGGRLPTCSAWGLGRLSRNRG